jgi:LPS-assembly lipoprotein
MSSPEARFSPSRLALALLLAASVGGCLQPMYAEKGPATAVAGGAPGAATSLAAIDILPMEGRVGQKIRNDLIFAFTGGGAPLPPAYRLDVALQVISAQTAVVDPFTDRPELETAGIDAAYTLTQVGTGVPVLSGNAFGRASYTTTRQRFSNVRAQRDAEDRAARVIVEQIRARLAGHFATGT